MKYFIGGVIVIVLVATAFLAGRKTKKIVSSTASPSISLSVAPTPAGRSDQSTSALIGNKVGDKAPDFRLKDTNGNDVSLRDYQNQGVKLEFIELGKLRLQGRILLDPDDIVHRLYHVTSMPYTVTIDEHGIIR